MMGMDQVPEDVQGLWLEVRQEHIKDHLPEDLFDLQNAVVKAGAGASSRPAGLWCMSPASCCTCCNPCLRPLLPGQCNEHGTISTSPHVCLFLFAGCALQAFARLLPISQSRGMLRLQGHVSDRRSHGNKGSTLKRPPMPTCHSSLLVHSLRCWMHRMQLPAWQREGSYGWGPERYLKVQARQHVPLMRACSFCNPWTVVRTLLGQPLHQGLRHRTACRQRRLCFTAIH
jgi:hypothetical protein